MKLSNWIYTISTYAAIIISILLVVDTLELAHELGATGEKLIDSSELVINFILLYVTWMVRIVICGITYGNDYD